MRVLFTFVLFAAPAVLATAADDPPQAPPPPQRPATPEVKHHTPSYNDCHDAATASGRSLVVWVNLHCPACERQVTQAVHCHTVSLRGSDTPRVVVGVYRDGKLWHSACFYDLPSTAALQEAVAGNGPQIISPAAVSPVLQPAFAPAFAPPAMFFGGESGGGCASGNCGGSAGGGRGRRR